AELSKGAVPQRACSSRAWSERRLLLDDRRSLDRRCKYPRRSHISQFQLLCLYQSPYCASGLFGTRQLKLICSRIAHIYPLGLLLGERLWIQIRVLASFHSPQCFPNNLALIVKAPLS